MFISIMRVINEVISDLVLISDEEDNNLVSIESCWRDSFHRQLKEMRIIYDSEVMIIW